MCLQGCVPLQLLARASAGEQSAGLLTLASSDAVLLSKLCLQAVQPCTLFCTASLSRISKGSDPALAAMLALVVGKHARESSIGDCKLVWAGSAA